MRKYILVLMALVCSLCLTLSVVASETVDPSIEIDIEIANEILGDEPLEDITFYYAIQGVESTYPLSDNILAYIEGEGNASFKNLLFTTPGVYEYQIYQLSGQDEDYSYDEIIYEVTVYIANDGNGGLESTIYAMKADTELKSASIIFTNLYVNTDDDTSTDTSADGTSTNTSTDSSDNSGGGTAETGDDAHVNDRIALMIFAVCMIVVVRRRKCLIIN